MKKTIVLLLALLGMVVNVNAADVTRRIVAVLEDNAVNAGLVTSWDGWKNGPHIHVFYNDGSDHVLTGTWWSTAMTYCGTYLTDSKARKVYYTDVTADESVFSTYDLNIIIAGKATDDAYNRITYTGRYLTDQVFYLYIDGTVKYSAKDIVYYLVNTDGAKLADLSYDVSTGLATGTYSNSDNTYAIVAANYALKDEFSGIRDWEMVMRPEGDVNLEINDFVNYPGNLTGSTKTFYFTKVSDFNLSFNIIERKYKIEPFFTTNISSVGYATFSSAYDVVCDADAYYASKAAGSSVSFSQYAGNKIPANQGALLKGSGTVTFTPAGETLSAPATNFLKASVTETNLTTGDSPYNYILAGTDASDLGFYYVNKARTSGAGKAYLQTDVALTTATLARVAMVFDDEAETTGIKELKSVKADGIFNLRGQRVMNAQKGLYIVNGKKMLMK